MGLKSSSTADGQAEDFFAEEATVTVWERQTNTIIGRYHILRKKEKDSENRTYEGSSKVMEGYGVNKVMQNLQKEGILVKSFTHDANASTLNIIQKYFPNSIEHLDINHSAKNLKRRIKNIGFKENGWKSNFAELWGKLLHG